MGPLHKRAGADLRVRSCLGCMLDSNNVHAGTRNRPSELKVLLAAVCVCSWYTRVVSLLVNDNGVKGVHKTKQTVALAWW